MNPITLFEGKVTYHIFNMINRVEVYAVTENSGAIGRGKRLKEALAEAKRMISPLK